MKKTDLESAWSMAMLTTPGEAAICIHRITGECFASFEETGEDDIPEGAEDDPNYVFLPDKYELELGRQLVEDFVAFEAPALADDVRRCFRGPGAYGRYKDLLQRKGLLQRWYDYEARREEEAMLEWCRENGIELEDD